MSKYIQAYPSTLLRFDDIFAYVTLTDFAEGRGLMQIHSDYGAYAYYWGSMGKPIREFLAGTSASYIHSKLQSSINYQSMKREAQRRLDKFMIDCWPDIHAKIKEGVPSPPPAEFSEDDFKTEWSVRGVGMGLPDAAMQGARCYHLWFVEQRPRL